MKSLYILACGAFYRPQQTPMGDKGWVGEITFYDNPLHKILSEKDPIREIFETQKEAEIFVGKELAKLRNDRHYRIKKYAPDGKYKSIC